MVQAHGEFNVDPSAGTYQEQFAYTLAAFLIVASESTFFGFSRGWYYNGTTWHDEYDKPLSPPHGDAVLVDGVWTRSFAHASVRLDLGNHNATIDWTT